MSEYKHVYWANAEETFKILADSPEQAEEFLSAYMSGNYDVPVKSKNFDLMIEETE